MAAPWPLALGIRPRLEALYRRSAPGAACSPSRRRAGLIHPRGAAGASSSAARSRRRPCSSTTSLTSRARRGIARLAEESRRVAGGAPGRSRRSRGLLPFLGRAASSSATRPGATSWASDAEVFTGGDVPQLWRLDRGDVGGPAVAAARPVAAAGRVDDGPGDHERGALRARRSRAIYPARVLEEAPEVMVSRAAAGEHVRILAEVPTRLAIIGTARA